MAGAVAAGRMTKGPLVEFLRVSDEETRKAASPGKRLSPTFYSPNDPRGDLLIDLVLPLGSFADL